MNKNLVTALGVFIVYGVTVQMIAAGMPLPPLVVSLFASSTAIGIIAVEWARV